MKINFLTGSLALRKYKTGVHHVHHNLLLKFSENGYLGWNTKISCYCTQHEMDKSFPEYKNEKYSEKIVFSHKLVKLLLYFLPIELFFGHSDIYFCDGIVPHTITKSKKVAIIHDLMVYVYPEYYGVIKKIYLKFFYRRCRNVDRIVTVSEATKKDVIKYLHINESRISVVNCGIEENLETVNKIENSGIDFQKKYLLYIGDMRKNKNLLNAIISFEKAYSEDNKLFFYIAGAQRFEYEALKKYVDDHDLKNVLFLGYVTDEEKLLLYRNAFALLFISEYEGFGIPILEAAKYDLPVVTSNTSSMKEIAEGYVITCNPYNINEVVCAIRSLNDPKTRNDIIIKQRTLVKKYSWNNSYKQLEKVLVSL